MFRHRFAALGLVALAGAFAPAAPAAAAPGATHCVADLDARTVTCADSGPAALRAARSSADKVIARLYEHIKFGGKEVAFVQARACTAGYDSEWQWEDLRKGLGANWNDRASSVRTYAKCDVRLYENIGFGGAASTWIDKSANLGTIGGGWNDRASSVKFS